MTQPIQRVLRYRISIGALLEIAVWLAIPYLCIGLTWAAFHSQQVERIHTRLEKVLPVGADVSAYGLTAVLWPASLQLASACPAD
jgi:H+/gluconate symporter-like permease